MSILIQIAFMLLMVTLVLGGSHAFLYVSFVKFFSVTDTWWKSVVALVLLGLALSFILSSMLAHWKDNVFTRNLYTISASWLGYLVYFVLAFVAAWWVVYIAAQCKVNLPLLPVGILAVVIATGIGFYGLWNAANPRIIEQTIFIRNLPAYWQGKKLVQISDVHMGHTLRQDFLWEIVDKINAVQPEALLITGDFYDGMDGSLEHLAEPLEHVQAKHGVFYVDGNHETYLGTSRSLEAIAATKVKILHDKSETIEWLQFAGVQYPERGETKSILGTLRNLPGFDIQKPYVFLFHKPWKIQDDGNLGSGLALFGHTHEGQLAPFALITRAIFGSFSYGLTRVWGMNAYVSSGVGTWGPPMRVGTIPEIVVFTLQNDSSETPSK